jgi:hypothetical protein
MTIMQRNGNHLPAVQNIDDGEIMETETVAPLSLAIRSEIEAQVSTARKYPRSIVKFKNDAFAMATLDPAVAASCGYSLPRGGKLITGPSVRLAEIVAACYGNLQVKTRIADEDFRFIVAEATCLDVERNVGVTVQVRRKITDRNGKTYNDDMITTTANAALAIARRNAIFAVIPNAFTQMIYREAMSCASGESTPFPQQCEQWVSHFERQKIARNRIFDALGVRGIDDMTDEHLNTLIGLDASIRAKETTLAEAFPVAIVVDPGKTKTATLKDELKGREPGSDG